MMRSLKVRNLMFFVMTLSVLLILGVNHAPAADESTEGDAWLRMNPDTRTGFLRGYTIGLSRGFAEGCDTYRSIEKPRTRDLRNDPFANCLNARGRGFSQPVDHYVKQVTDFYESFPSDRTVPFEEVLKKLSDSDNMTPQQMHKWFEEHGHRK
ncbi:MAG: hypothetical protein ABSH01_16370 [Terriglobia bacterium]|jgi:hypothetical protein